MDTEQAARSVLPAFTISAGVNGDRGDEHNFVFFVENDKTADSLGTASIARNAVEAQSLSGYMNIRRFQLAKLGQAQSASPLMPIHRHLIIY